MQVSLEITRDTEDEGFASVVCNVLPRVGDYITLLGGNRGRYYVTGIDHVLSEDRIESVQHVCVYVTAAPERKV